MPVYDWRNQTSQPLPRGFLYDRATGEEIPLVFFWDTETGWVGRYVAGAGGAIRLGVGHVPEVVWEIRDVRMSWESADEPIVLERVR